MTSLQILLTLGFALILVVVVALISWQGVRGYRKLKDPNVSAKKRHQMQICAVIFKWCLVVPVVQIWVIDPSSRPVVLADGWWWVIVQLLVLAVVSAAVLLRRLRSPTFRDRVARSLVSVAALLPRTPGERWLWAIVAITAGVTEEILFRVLLIAYIQWLFPGGAWLGAVVISAFLFGLVHVYQGWKGVLQTGWLGITLGGLYVTSGLAAPILLHTLIDLRPLLFPLDLVRPDPEPATTSGGSAGQAPCSAPITSASASS